MNIYFGTTCTRKTDTQEIIWCSKMKNRYWDIYILYMECIIFRNHRYKMNWKSLFIKQVLFHRMMEFQKRFWDIYSVREFSGWDDSHHCKLWMKCTLFSKRSVHFSRDMQWWMIPSLHAMCPIHLLSNPENKQIGLAKIFILILIKRSFTVSTKSACILIFLFPAMNIAWV